MEDNIVGRSRLPVFPTTGSLATEQVQATATAMTSLSPNVRASRFY
ncbi:hypothetical protein [Sphingomonas sp. PP-CE-1A-559]|nr:hypothetical protein [Sphingomonas sp. PP-CE-1A-559]